MSWNPPGQKPGKRLPPRVSPRPPEAGPGSGAGEGGGEGRGEGRGDEPGRAAGSGQGAGSNGSGSGGNHAGNGGNWGSNSGDRDPKDRQGAGSGGNGSGGDRDSNGGDRGGNSGDKGRKSPYSPKKTGYQPDPRANAPRRYASDSGGDRDPDGSKFPPGLDDFMRRLTELLGPGPGTPRLVLLVLLAALGTWAGLGFHQVAEGERALVLRNGRVLTLQGPGRHWNPPFIDTWRSVNVSAVREAALSTEVVSHDEDLVAVTLALRYRIADPAAWLLRFDDADAELLHAVEAALQAGAARLDVEELQTSGQRELVATVQREVEAHLRRRGSGLALVGLSLERVTTPPALDDIVATVSQARADISTTVQQARASGDAEQKRLQGEARARVAAAETARAATLQRAELDALRLRAAIDAARTDPAGTRRRLYEEAVADVLARTPTVIVGEQGLGALGIPPEKLRSPSPLPPSPGTEARP